MQEQSFEETQHTAINPQRGSANSNLIRPAQRRKNTTESQNSGKSLTRQESGHFRQVRANQLSRKQSDLSVNANGPDGLSDLFKESGHTRNGTHSAMGEKRKLTTNGAHGTIKPTEDSKWIHRDKLAQIESKELEEAGFRVPRQMSRSDSRTQSRARSRGQSTERRERSQSRNRRTTEEYNIEESLPPANTLHSRYSSKDLKESQRYKAPTPIQPLRQEEEILETEPEHDDPAAWDLRTPAEIAADRERARSGSRPGGSRLPLAMDSPIPVPNIVVERDSPLTRSRQGSSAANRSILEPAIVFNRNGRSGSVGSEVLLDEAETPQNPSFKQATPSPPQTSPSKAKSPTKINATGKKKDRTTSGTKPRQSSSNTKRPGTSEGLQRPQTGHRPNRPEGEAPWIATMYKPDPSLPPDQQIIPTHARRMAQQQWEQEGKTGSIYDTNFGLLNTEEFNRPATRTPPEEEKKQEEGQQWPIIQPASPKPESIRPGGGYKTIPTISSPQTPARSTPTPNPRPVDSIRMEDPGEDEKPQKKGCCCIIM
ncbi:hypothetical protein EJ05DRAFT_372468 [Pseudovirgaria hyperparasitica]|uniref:Pal1-domain-containing protein n=1 Tax=Pseudovirgaria hyperparasitica TaxID=470096 RepID=A0A6A6W4Z2_9PEZI|nr:uncharacterized protein EJ05DRAFT_372468 [Pseudovirgaria hyperparasitica]KAF2757942.1 hypothetical protein EJ05DRAFT_372468 [Pseudovirgaria hyperparasitica]